MNFTSPLFLIGFPLVCVLYRKLPGIPRDLSEHAAHGRASQGLLSRQTFLLLASWLFYMGGSLKCFPLLLLVTLATYLGGITIDKARAEKKRPLRGEPRPRADLCVWDPVLLQILWICAG